jgi:hypothetical protein
MNMLPNLEHIWLKVFRFRAQPIIAIKSLKI